MGDEDVRSWHTLYKAALAEKDVQKLSLRIQEARRAVVLRSRELFFSASPDSDDEAEAIEAAMYGLNALESCVKLKTKDRRRFPRVD